VLLGCIKYETNHESWLPDNRVDIAGHQEFDVIPLVSRTAAVLIALTCFSGCGNSSTVPAGSNSPQIVSSASPSPSADLLTPYVSLVNQLVAARSTAVAAMNSRCASLGFQSQQADLDACITAAQACHSSLSGTVSNLDRATPPVQVGTLGTTAGTDLLYLAADCQAVLQAVQTLDLPGLAPALDRFSTDDRVAFAALRDLLAALQHH
jgi:hypothetical protein